MINKNNCLAAVGRRIGLHAAAVASPSASARSPVAGGVRPWLSAAARRSTLPLAGWTPTPPRCCAPTGSRSQFDKNENDARRRPTFFTSARFFTNSFRLMAVWQWQRNVVAYKYVRLTTNQTDTKSIPNRNPSTEQQAIMSIQVNIVTCLMYREKLITENVIATFVQLSIVIVKLPRCLRETLWPLFAKQASKRKKIRNLLLINDTYL